MVNNEQMQLAAKANDKANFGHVFIPALEDALVDHHAENGQFVDLVFRDDAFRHALNALMMDRVYGRLTPSRADAVARIVAAGIVAETAPTAAVLPFRRMSPAEVKPFENCVPLLAVKVAAGRFAEGGVEQGRSLDDAVRDPGAYEWVALSGRTRPGPGLFVAQVVGESMNRLIPNGAWCLWRAGPVALPEGKVVLAQHRGIADAETGGTFTVKRFGSERRVGEAGLVENVRVTLAPRSRDPGFEAIVVDEADGDEVAVLAELVGVLG